MSSPLLFFCIIISTRWEAGHKFVIRKRHVAEATIYRTPKNARVGKMLQSSCPLIVGDKETYGTNWTICAGTDLRGNERLFVCRVLRLLRNFATRATFNVRWWTQCMSPIINSTKTRTGIDSNISMRVQQQHAASDERSAIAKDITGYRQCRNGIRSIRRCDKYRTANWLL